MLQVPDPIVISKGIKEYSIVKRKASLDSCMGCKMIKDILLFLAAQNYKVSRDHCFCVIIYIYIIFFQYIGLYTFEMHSSNISSQICLNDLI